MANRQQRSLNGILQSVALILLICLVAFVAEGAPGQMTTFLGLAGAGLTVALKDFIVAFFGWFVLMGKNGIRVGDWVEINGIGGEVVEVGVLRTVLLETGNWSDAGHPTGRKVVFVRGGCAVALVRVGDVAHRDLHADVRRLEIEELWRAAAP